MKNKIKILITGLVICFCFVSLVNAEWPTCEDEFEDEFGSPCPPGFKCDPSDPNADYRGCVAPVGGCIETFYIEDDSLPADGSETKVWFRIFCPGRMVPEILLDGKVCYNTQKVGFFNLSSVEENVLSYGYYRAPILEPTAELSGTMKLILRLSLVRSELEPVYKEIPVYIEIGEYVPPQASETDKALACKWAPQLWTKRVPSNEKINAIYYTVNRYGGDKIYISYIVSWNTQRDLGGLFLGHDFDYEPIVVVLNVKEWEVDIDEQITLEQVMYDKGHYSVGRTNSLSLEVHHWSHCYRLPYNEYEATNERGFPLLTYSKKKKIAESTFDCAKLEIWTVDILQDMNKDLSTLPNYPGQCQDLSLRNAFSRSWQISDCFGRTRYVAVGKVEVIDTRRGTVTIEDAPCIFEASKVNRGTAFVTGGRSQVFLKDVPSVGKVQVAPRSGYYFGGSNQPGYVLYGRVYVQDKSGKKTTYTDDAIVKSVKTEYEIVVGSEGETSVFVFEGSVKLSNLDGSKTVQIDAGKTATVEFNGQPSYPVAFDPATIDRWWETEPGTTPTPATTVEENFNDGQAQNWIDEGVLGNWAVSDGVYVMTGSHSPSLVHTTCWSYYDREFCDFSYQVDVRKIAGDPSDWLEYYGLLIRSDGTWGNAYMFETRVDGDYLIGKIVEGKFTNLVDWTSSDALKPGYNQWNTLKVVAQGSILKFYANDILLTTVEDTSFSCGKVGLFAGASGDSDSPDTVQFDNVIIIPSTGGARTDGGASTCENNQPPSVSINTVTPTSGPAPLTVSIEATAFDPDGGIVEWRWDFGADGIVDVVERVEEVHPGENRFWFEKATFTAPPGASITSIVTVEDNCGATASAEFVITIEG